MRMPRLRPSTQSTSATTHSAWSRYLRSCVAVKSDASRTTPKASVHKYRRPFGQMPSLRIMASFATTYGKLSPVIARPLDSEGIRIGKARALLGLQRRDRPGLVEPDVFVELTRQNGLEIMALKLGLRPVDH